MSVARQDAEVQVLFPLVPKEIANRSALESAYRPTGRPRTVGPIKIPVPHRLARRGKLSRLPISDLSRFSVPLFSAPEGCRTCGTEVEPRSHWVSLS
jgi:hypothetical protein